MAIVALILAVVLFWLARRRPDPDGRRIMLIVAGIALALALLLIVFDPRMAFDMRFLGRLVTHVTGRAVHDMLR